MLETTSQHTQNLIGKVSEQIDGTQKAAILATIADVQERVKQNQILSSGVNFLKLAAVLAAGVWIWRRL